jgi:hypothetical protein
LKGVGRVYQQTVIDTYAKVAFAKLYDRKTPITAAEILNDRVVPFYDEHGIRLSRVLTDRRPGSALWLEGCIAISTISLLTTNLERWYIG